MVIKMLWTVHNATETRKPNSSSLLHRYSLYRPIQQPMQPLYQIFDFIQAPILISQLTRLHFNLENCSMLLRNVGNFHQTTPRYVSEVSHRHQEQTAYPNDSDGSIKLRLIVSKTARLAQKKIVEHKMCSVFILRSDEYVACYAQKRVQVFM